MCVRACLCSRTVAGLVLLGLVCPRMCAKAASVPPAISPGQHQIDKAAASQIGIFPGSLNFAQQQIWTTSGAKVVNIKNLGSTVLDFVSIVASGDYRSR